MGSRSLKGEKYYKVGLWISKKYQKHNWLKHFGALISGLNHFILFYLSSALRVRLEEIQEVSYRQSDKIIALRSVAKVDFSSVPTKIIKLYKLYLKFFDFPLLKIINCIRRFSNPRHWRAKMNFFPEITVDIKSRAETKKSEHRLFIFKFLSNKLFIDIWVLFYLNFEGKLNMSDFLDLSCDSKRFISHLGNCPVISWSCVKQNKKVTRLKLPSPAK